MLMDNSNSSDADFVVPVRSGNEATNESAYKNSVAIYKTVEKVED